ncbi:MAG: S41 family peptidase [Phycisphaerae bacterium]
MHQSAHSTSWFRKWVMVSCAVLIGGVAVRGDDTRQARARAQDELWRRSVDRVTHGDFAGASAIIADLSAGGWVTRQVRDWLAEYEAQQQRRREMDRADFEKYVRYAKQRIDRNEYRLALDWVLWANDCAEEPDALRNAPWVKALTDAALVEAEKLRSDREWRKAWQLYTRLGALYEHEPRYKKLENEVATHWRLDVMFEDGNNWDERLDKVRWREAERALVDIEQMYVKPVDFRKVAEAGLEQLLLLAESKSAQERFEGLRDELDRHDFRARVQRRLDEIRAADHVDRRDAQRHFRRVVKKINPNTINLPEKLIVAELMRGALEPLDEFTSIFWPTDATEFEKRTRGDFTGVGISIIKNKLGEIEVVSPLEDSPAYRAGIQAGDIITHADGKSLKGVSLTKTVNLITGPRGKLVTLTIRRDDHAVEFPLIRDKITLRSIKGLTRDEKDPQRWHHWLDEERRIAYVRITNFQEHTVEHLFNILTELKAKGMTGLALDLRRNPGGLLDAASNVAALFLRKGDEIVSTKGRLPTEDQTFSTGGDGPFAGLPLVVLADEGSASGSEIVAGAIRDNDRGIVIGARTFGKFSVQHLVPLGHTNNAKLKITTAHYYLPSGVSLHRTDDAETWGVEPQVPVKLVWKEQDRLREIVRERDRLGPLPTPKPAGADDNPDAASATGGDADDKADKTDTKDPAENAAPDQRSPEANSDSAEHPKVVAENDATNDDDLEGPQLPPLEQPNENDRPKADPQLDTAKLLLRVKTLSRKFPTLASAERTPVERTARP